MKYSLVVASLTFLLCLADPAMADGAAGRWAVAGNVDGKDFTLDCSFQQSGQNLTGACIDGPTGDAKVPGGRSHRLLESQAMGNDISWTYETSYLFLKFNVKYTGIQDGDHMIGTISAAGKTGKFTATRVAS